MRQTILDLIERRVPPRYQHLARQFLKFGLVGTVGAIVDFSSYNILTRGLGWQTVFEVLGYKIIAANLISVLLAILSNFLLNKYWTFRNREAGAAVKQGLGYFGLNGITFVLNQILTSFFTFHVPIVASLFGGQKDNAAKALSIGVILFINFLGSKFIIFRRKSYGHPLPQIPPKNI
jgi:putative flippase GtrA